MGPDAIQVQLDSPRPNTPNTPKPAAPTAQIVEPTGLRRTLLFAAVRTILFTAWWFGAKRFDADGDGDIDDVDVMAFLENANILNKQFVKEKKIVQRPGSPVTGKNAQLQIPSPAGFPSKNPSKSAASPPVRASPQNDEGAPVKVGRYVADGYDGAGTYYCGRTLGIGVAQETGAPTAKAGHCGPLLGPQCPSCQRFQRKEQLTPGQQVEAQWADSRYYPATLMTANIDGTYRVRFTDDSKGRRDVRLDQLCVLVQHRKPVPLAMLDGATSAVDPMVIGGLGDAEMTVMDSIMDNVIESDISGVNEEEQVAKLFMTGQAGPYFIGVQTSLALALWLAFALKQGIEGSATSIWWAKAGLDSFSEGNFDLQSYRDCVDLRSELWRWWSYQFTHVGSLHVLSNSAFNVVFGIPMEGIHGSLRLALMYNIGVLGGACCYFVTSAHAAVVGMSGGCYSLLGMHIADLIVNWNSKKYRKPTMIIILGMAGVDLAQYFGTQEEGTKSHAAHTGGCLAGLAIGLVFGHSMKPTWYRKYLIIVALIASFLLVCTCFAWMAVAWPPRNIWETEGYCWARQVHSPERLGDDWECVRCGSIACIDRWSSEPFIAPVALGFCEDRGWAISEP